MRIQKCDKGLHVTTSDHIRKSEDQWTAILFIVVLCGVALNHLAALWEWGNGGMGMWEKWYRTYKAQNCQLLALCADCVPAILIVIEGLGVAQRIR